MTQPQRGQDRIFVILTHSGHNLCFKCLMARATWAVYLHGDPEPAGTLIDYSCTAHLGSLLNQNRYFTVETS